jgi:hypothetical protein
MSSDCRPEGPSDESTCVRRGQAPCHCVPVGVDQVISRRAVLITATGIAGAGILTGCGGGTEISAAAADPVSTEVAAAEQSLIAQYQTFITAFPELSAELTPLLDQHADHARAIGVKAPASTAPVAAADARTAIAVLADIEREAAKARRASCVAATDPELARIVALIAASEASHAPALTRLLAT